MDRHAPDRNEGGLIRLDQITVDPRAQPRASIEKVLIAEYAEAMAHGAVFPPIVVFDDDVHFWLADGFHRYYAAIERGVIRIPADVRKGGIRDAILYSCRANTEHQVLRSEQDERRAVMRMISDPEWSAWTDIEIAKRCEVNLDLVRFLRKSEP